MTDAIRVSGPVNAAGTEMSFETGRLAQLADGAVLVQLGETTLLTTVVTSTPREGIDFFPLTVDVEERMYAAGKIPGSFFRREGRPGEQAILTCRLTDRPLRPSFPEGFRNEVQVISTIMGADLANPHDIASINGGVGSAHGLGHPVQRPDRLGARRAGRRRVGRAPDLPARRRGDLRDGRRGSTPRRRRRRDHDGRGRRHRRHVAPLRGRRAEDHRGRDRRGARGLEAVDQRVHRPPARAREEGRGREWPDRADRVRAAGRLPARRL